MRQLIYFFGLSVALMGCKCRIAKETTSKVYNSIADSKKNGAFLEELRPQSTFLYVNKRGYYIKEAWLERAHIEKNFRDILTDMHSLVINFKHEPGDSVDLHYFVKEDGNSRTKIWINLTKEATARDTIIVQYRETLDSANKNKMFLLFKIK